MANKILKHVEVITQHRDEALLDITVIKSLLELLKVPRIRFHEICQKRGQFWAASTEWSDGDEVRYFQDLLVDDDFGPIGEMQPLVQAIQSAEAVVVREEADAAHHYWFPIFFKDRVRSCFEIAVDGPLNDQQMDVAKGILGLYRNYLSLLEDSQQDTLTGLANRKTFDSSLNRILATAGTSSSRREDRRQHASQTHWLAIIDIDHFKRINDRFGHLYGDEILILIANLMRRSFRQQDRLFRFGGEEFVVLLRKVDIQGALNTLERFRKTCENHAFPDSVGPISVSIGFARISPEDTAAAILGYADEALYFAKAQGRNQVQCYEYLIESGRLHRKQFNSEVELF